jgi:protein arginine kinase activator
LIPKNRLCDICSNRPARLLLLRRTGDDVYRTHVCQECANERARLSSRTTLDFERMLDRLRGRSAGERASYSCRFCGTTLADVVVDGRPGCCLCYERYAEELAQMIEEAQGRVGHVGKTPGGS